MLKLKILIIGLSGSGKTAIANFLSESVDTEAINDIRPTQGARIMEFDSPTLNVNGKQLKAEVELWDCSGDHKFESCWPAIRNNSHGVIFVCSPANLTIATKDFELLYNYFVTQPNLSPKQCVFFYNTMEAQQDTKIPKLPTAFSSISQVPVSITNGGNKLRNDFANYLISVITALNK